MSTDLIKPEIGKVMTDAETGEQIAITESMVKEAIACHARLEMGVFITAMSLKEMRDKKLYLALGHTGFRGYIENELPFGKTHAYRYLLVADNLISAGYDTESVPKRGHLEGLGLHKLTVLSKANEEQRARLMAEGIISLGDGDYSVDDLKKMVTKELTDKLSKLAPKIAQIPELEQDLKTAQSEVDYLRKDREKLEKEVSKLRTLAGTDAVAKGLRDVDFHINATLRIMTELFKNPDLTEESRERLSNSFHSLYDQLDTWRNMNIDNLGVD